MSDKKMIPILQINGKDVSLEASWEENLRGEIEEPYFAELVEKLNSEYKKACYPSEKLIFNAFNLCPFDKVKVVILGQDPYHEQGQAMGLSFSVPDGVKLPPSLRKIYKEIEDNLCKTMPESGDLTRWAEQGVLLLNTTLTVRDAKPNSHKRFKWQNFTDAAIKALNKNRENIVFMLWGNDAKRKKRLIDTERHHIIESYHPTARQRYKFKKHQFTCCNAYLKQQGMGEIDWLMRTEERENERNER
ncbi:uracil-DNA glycosylase [Prevotella intermedia]|uniref:Uracil-DNA glycosylase n=1 Tax=Prevotella intermedia TaxID=28131 RepID=A0A2D3LIX8_PREIN|nr:uracil-DNA glycosylase [Prevotella intermedia]ATV30513.1 uracil-DNA glycosylase [Prevotella intermedia]PJI23236.1 uracil-DNA glycosylase [Prevotella intermedia]